MEVFFLCPHLQNAHFPLILMHSTKNCTEIREGGSKTGWCFASSTLYFQVNTFCSNPVCISSSFVQLLHIDFIVSGSVTLNPNNCLISKRLSSRLLATLICLKLLKERFWSCNQGNMEQNSRAQWDLWVLPWGGDTTDSSSDKGI